MRLSMLFVPAVAICLWNAPAAAQTDTAEPADQRSLSSHAVELTTGINPDHYPCARDSILKLYERRQELSSLSAYHPRRLWVWLEDNLSYYSAKVITFFKGFFTRESLNDGIRGIQSIAQGNVGNPLSSLDNKVEGWIKDLSPHSQEALKAQVEGLVRATTKSDGTCK